jgi:hypothetical protein
MQRYIPDERAFRNHRRGKPKPNKLICVIQERDRVNRP